MARTERAEKPRRRADRDGDVKMGLEPSNRVTKNNRGRGGGRGRGRGGITNTTRKTLTAAAQADASMDGDRNPKQSGLVEFKITGWENSAASHSADGGANSLKEWLESKMSRKLGSAAKRQVRFKKWRVDDSTVYASVPEVNARVLERMNGFSWAKVTLQIERVGGPVQGLSSQAEETKAMLQDVLNRRYNDTTQFMDLSNLVNDPQLKSRAIFDTTYTASKFFPAMMRVLEYSIESPEERSTMVQSVSLADNSLEDVKVVSSLSATLPKLKNLDLSNNQLKSLAALSAWRHRFKNLEHLVISGNPLEKTEVDYANQLLKWYPNLRFINNIQVRTEEDIKSKVNVSNIPFPIKGPLFVDEGGIAETFIKNFFLGFDTDRVALASTFYDEQSRFSFAVNTGAPRDPKATNEIAKGDWDAYIKHSRNLKKLQHPSARHSRQARGSKAVADLLMTIPKTKHPDLVTEGSKWMVEAHLIPGLPDITGQSPSGVDGFSIDIHGEYQELDAKTNQPTKKRSVDHMIMLGPAAPGSSAGVRVVTHNMTIRAYGGAQAFEPDYNYNAVIGAPSPPVQEAVVPGLPAGITIPIAEQMMAQFQEATGLTLEYCKMCFDEVGWDMVKAHQAFLNVKSTLGPEVYALKS